MRYLRLFSVLLLLSLAVTGCHRKQARTAPAPQAQAPIVTTLPPIPPLTFPDVQLGKPKPAAPVTPQPVAQPEPPKKPHTERVRRHHPVHKTEPETETSGVSAAKPTGADPGSVLPEKSPASMLGQLSAADDASPNQNVQTKQLIEETESRLKQVSAEQQTKHKEDIVQVTSFLTQAKQAWAMNDLVGAQTLANKAKILLDELLK